MTFVHVLVGITVISTGLFTGLLMTVLFFFERALRDLSGTERNELRAVGSLRPR